MPPKFTWLKKIGVILCLLYCCCARQCLECLYLCTMYIIVLSVLSVSIRNLHYTLQAAHKDKKQLTLYLLCETFANSGPNRCPNPTDIFLIRPLQADSSFFPGLCSLKGHLGVIFREALFLFFRDIYRNIYRYI